MPFEFSILVLHSLLTLSFKDLENLLLDIFYSFVLYIFRLLLLIHVHSVPHFV